MTHQALPVPGFDENPPLDMSRYTDWESHEIRHLWRDAVRQAAIMASCAADIHHTLLNDDLTQRHRWDLDGGGDSQPGYVATKLSVLITRLLGVINGAEHRLAVDRHREAETPRDKVLRWGAWSWADGRAYPEPACPTDDEFAAVMRSFGYEPWKPDETD